MKNLLLKNAFTELWSDAYESKSITNYLVALWITGLAGLATVSWVYLVVRSILEPTIWNGVSFGVFDYI